MSEFRGTDGFNRKHTDVQEERKEGETESRTSSGSRGVIAIYSLFSFSYFAFFNARRKSFD